MVNNYADTDKTIWTLLENFEGFSQILKEQSGEKYILGCFKNPRAIILKNENVRIKRKMCMSAYSLTMRTCNFNFVIEYLCENEKVLETVFPCSNGAKVESFKQKMVENLVTLSL